MDRSFFQSHRGCAGQTALYSLFQNDASRAAVLQNYISFVGADFLLAAQRLQILPEACMVLEDSGNGLHSAHCADMKVICILDIAPPPKERLSLASEVFPDLTSVFDWIMAQP